jgi:hypothetical protein
LRPLTRAVSADLAWGLLADPHRVEARRAGYRLLRLRGIVEQLRAALLVAADPDPRLARPRRCRHHPLGPGRRQSRLASPELAGIGRHTGSDR